jgi:hypothetical protein
MLGIRYMHSFVELKDDTHVLTILGKQTDSSL